MPAAKSLPLPRGPLKGGERMKRVLPVIVRVARAFPARTVLTRFIPPVRAADAEGMWRQYYQRWSEFTRERLPPHFLALLPELAELVRPLRSWRNTSTRRFRSLNSTRAYRIAR